MPRRLLAVLAASMFAAGATAAPVPKSPPPPAPETPADMSLCSARVEGDVLLLTDRRLVPVAPPRAVVKPQGRQAPGAEWRVREVVVRVGLEGTVGSTAGGKPLTADELVRAIGDGAWVARSAVPIDPEWKRLFADDVIFLEPKEDSPPPPAPPAR